MTSGGYSRASDETIAGWRALAEQVREALLLAGLPAAIDAAERSVVGAVIDIDEGDDAAGGVFVRWEPDVPLADGATHAIMAGELESPVVAHAGRVSKAMGEAIVEILRSAQFDVAHASEDDEYGPRPFHVHVTARRAERS